MTDWQLAAIAFVSLLAGITVLLYVAACIWGWPR
jgi:hypothetical protein